MTACPTTSSTLAAPPNGPITSTRHSRASSQALRHLELELARPHVLAGSCALEAVARVQPLRVGVDGSHPEKHQAVTLRPGPVQDGLDQEVADARPPPEPRIHPHGG